MKGAIVVRLVAGCAGLVGQDGPKKERKDLPDGAAKDLFIRICEKCHGSENVVRARYDREKWESVVDDMVSRGAEGTDEELDKIVEYLVKNFGKEKK